MKRLLTLPLVALFTLAACDESPTTPDAASPPQDEAAPDVLVITQGIQAPPRVPMPERGRPLFSTLENAQVSLGGSVTTPLSLNGAHCPAEPARLVTIAYTVSGSQRSDASFKVYSKWQFNGMEFVGSDPTTVLVRPRMGNPELHRVEISVENTSGLGSGTTEFVVAPFDLVTNSNDPPGLQLRLDASGNATVYVQFVDCDPAPDNTPPTLTLPANMTVEATSSAGAFVEFEVFATDAEDGDLTASVVCTPESGSLFPIDETTVVTCSVTDSGGLTAEGSFTIRVVDTTPPYFTSFPGDQTLIAANIHGAVLDLESLGIDAEDWNNVSEPVTVACDYVAGSWLPIGSTTTVSCTATDARGNESDPGSFDVFVTLDLTGVGFLPPLRMAAPYSAHKAGSTIPHKFPAPRYADGTPATDLADGLRLTLTRDTGNEQYEQSTGEEYAAGSTVWRYDSSSGHYIFNLKSEKGWGTGAWTTAVSYAGIELARTNLTFR